MASAEAENKMSIYEGGSDSALDRIRLFSDAVIAIALTLLALEIRLPAEHHLTDARLLEILGSLWPRYLAFFISFLVIATFWVVHWRKFEMIGRADSRLVWLNFLFLFFICCLPFATSVIGEHGGLRTAVIVYALSVIAVSLSSAGLSLYARQAGLVKPGIDPKAFRRGISEPLLGAAVFAVSIGVAFYSPDAAKYFWLLIVITSLRGLRVH